MKVAIMQPYFFPYLGYFQLISAVDQFVIYDDVNYINRGWINRNNILVKGQAHRITLPLENSSQNLHINLIKVSDSGSKLLKTIAQNYNKAPYFDTVFPILECALLHEKKNLHDYLAHQLRVVCGALDIQTKLLISSNLSKDQSLKGQEKILAICEELHASEYINSVGGKSLYERTAFGIRGIQLSFLQTRSVVYTQFGKQFSPNLSIIDVLMFNTPEQRRNLLAAYDLQ